MAKSCAKQTLTIKMVSNDLPHSWGGHLKRWSIFEVTNATNRKNLCCRDYDIEEDEEDDVYLDYAVDDWLPVIPAIGIFWEF